MASALTAMAISAREMGLELSDELLERFQQYGDLLGEWNQRFNLTSLEEPNEIAFRHFLDSLSCATMTGDLGGRRLVDVGSGAGFPGLPLKMLYPSMHLTLVESVAKKARFLEEVVNRLGLHGVDVMNERVETLGHDPVLRASHDWAVARAVAQMAVLAEYLFPLVRLGGRILVQKGPGAVDEVASAAEALQAMGGGPPIIRRIELPGRKEERYLVVVEKIAFTPLEYPRRPGIPSKRPL